MCRFWAGPLGELPGSHPIVSEVEAPRSPPLQTRRAVYERAGLGRRPGLSPGLTLGAWTRSDGPSVLGPEKYIGADNIVAT